MAVPETSIWLSWKRTAETDAVSDKLDQLLKQINQQVATSGFACQQSGRCCKFESFGHRLYMSGLEIAAFKLRVGKPPESPQSTGIPLPQIDPRQDGCPYQVDGMCSVHEHRPFACRVFFCQEGSDDWQSQQYEAHQKQIKKLHEDNSIPYHYMEWRQGLADANDNEL